MEEFLFDIQQVIQKRNQIEPINYWALVRNVFERHAAALSSCAVLTLDDSLGTVLLTQTRRFYHSEVIGIALMMINAQFERNFDSCSGTLLRDSLQVLQKIDPELIKLIGSEIASFTRSLTTLACHEGQPAVVIRPLIRLSLGPAQRHSYLCSIDADILQACISAHMYSFALNYLKTYRFNEIDPATSPITATDLMRFFYYSGIVYISGKHFEDALNSFDQALSLPASQISILAIDSYKKALLVNLIHNGKKYHIPSYSSPTIHRLPKQSDPYSSTAYSSLADAFIENDFEKVSQIIGDEQNQLKFLNDSNIGLVKQVIDSFHTQRIVRVSLIYSTISLDGLLKNISRGIPQDQLRYTTNEQIIIRLQELFAKELIFGTINQETNMVTFSEKSSNAKTIPSVSELEEKLKVAMSGYSSLRSMHEEVVQSQQLIHLTVSKTLHEGGGNRRVGSDLND